MLQPTDVTLVSGERVSLMLGDVSCPEQRFVRMSPRLIAGIVEEQIGSGIFVWQEVDGAYRYLGNIILVDTGADGVVWQTVVAQPRHDAGFVTRAESLFDDQTALHSDGVLRPHCFNLLSGFDPHHQPPLADALRQRDVGAGRYHPTLHGTRSERQAERAAEIV